MIRTILDNLQSQEPDLLEGKLIDDTWIRSFDLDYTLVVVDCEGWGAWFPRVDVFLEVLLQAVERECLDFVQSSAAAFDGGGWASG